MLLSLLVAASLSAPASAADQGLDVTVVLPSGARVATRAALHELQTQDGSAFALTMAPGKPQGLAQVLASQPAVGPYCAVAELFEAPTPDDRAAATVQIAAWKVLQPGLAAADPELDLAAATLAADAWRPCATGRSEAVLRLDPRSGWILPAAPVSVAVIDG